MAAARRLPRHRHHERGPGLDIVDVSTNPLAEVGVEPDVLIECSGTPRATGTPSSPWLARAGSCWSVWAATSSGYPFLTCRTGKSRSPGAFRYANTWPTAIELAASGRVDLDAVVTGHYDLASAEAALTAARSDPTAVKVIVQPGR